MSDLSDASDYATKPILPVDGMTEIPAYHDDPLMMGAWVACLSWATGQPDIMAAFKTDTGYDLDSITMARGIDKMVYDATGYTRTAFIAWCDWATKNLWGTDDAEPVHVEEENQARIRDYE